LPIAWVEHSPIISRHGGVRPEGHDRSERRVSTWLSTEWFDETRPLWSEVPVADELSGRVQCEISGGPEGSNPCHWVLEGGRVVDSGPGVIDGPDVTLTLAWDDALALHRGDVDPSVSFMRGRLKVAGSMALMLGLLAAAATDTYRDVRRQVVEVTDF
jgi:SCP-2 sterol transfer family